MWYCGWDERTDVFALCGDAGSCFQERGKSEEEPRSNKGYLGLSNTVA